MTHLAINDIVSVNDS